MPPSAKANSSTPGPAKLLLDRKAMKKQMANGALLNSPTSKKAQEVVVSSRGAPTYSPQQLLNPRALASRTAKGRSASTMSAPESSAPESTASSPGSESDGQKRKVSNDGADLIENLYGVERRSERPPKQIKVEQGSNGETLDPGPMSRSKPSFNAQSTGTVGSFMKESKESEAELTASLVDLTNDDDEEVVITSHKDIGDEVVCYGMVKATIHAHRTPKPQATAFDAPGSWPLIQCNIVRDPARHMVIKVAGPDHNDFGKLDPTISSALSPVLDKKFPGFRTVVRIPMRSKQPGEVAGAPCSDIINVQITIYGPRRNTEAIGKFFAQKNIWFEKPLAVEKGYILFNPHADQRRLMTPLGQGVQSRSVYSDARTIEEATTAVSKMFDSLATSDRVLPQMETSPLIVTPLLDHQKQALWFMNRREQARVFSRKEEENTSLWREEILPNGAKGYTEIVSGVKLRHEPPQVLGGLLADMMGLGKTIEILALIASTYDAAQHFSKQKLLRVSPEDTQHLRNAKTTLLISPLSAVKNWEDQLREHVQPGGLTYYVYHGSGRTKNAFELANYDIVIATYGTVAYEVSRQNVSPLQQIRWFRIVLDEAHTIREQKTVQSQVIYSLWATRRWAVTGTPIQNRLEDLGSLVKFLRLYPYNEAGKFAQYIKGPVMSGNAASLKSLRVFVDSFTLRRLKDQVDLPKREEIVVRLDFSPEEKELHEFFRRESNAKMQIVTQKGTKGSMSYMLTSITTLRLVSAHGKDLLNSKDRAKLRGATKQEAIDLDESTQQQLTPTVAYEILDLMVDAGFNTCMQCTKQAIAIDPSTSEEEDTTGAMFSCFDIVCKECLKRYQEAFDKVDSEMPCPICSVSISKDYVEVTWDGLEDARAKKETTAMQPKAKRSTYQGPHTKTRALLNDLASIKQDSAPFIEKGEPPIKSVVFSEFTSHLDLIGRALKDYDHKFLRIDGTMGLNQRRKVLDRFADDNEITVLLASIKAAGQGLNLTAASRAFIMEPLWNPAAEQQAVDRVHRLGQKRDVLITRFLMNNSIEVKIRELQNAKQKMADISMNPNHKALSKQEQREESIKMLRGLFK